MKNKTILAALTLTALLSAPTILANEEDKVEEATPTFGDFIITVIHPKKPDLNN